MQKSVHITTDIPWIISRCQFNKMGISVRAPVQNGRSAESGEEFAIGHLFWLGNIGRKWTVQNS
jgi:hypothetical protein